MHLKVLIECSVHGFFEQSPSNHLAGRGCYYCGREVHSTKKRSSTDKFIEKATQIHGNKFDYTHVKYITAHSKVQIQCPMHGVFEQAPHHHLEGGGCPKCFQTRNIERLHAQRHTTNKFIEKANMIHNFKFNYEKTVYVNKKTDVIIICPEHGEFSKKPKDHFKIKTGGFVACKEIQFCTIGK